MASNQQSARLTVEPLPVTPGAHEPAVNAKERRCLCTRSEFLRVQGGGQRFRSARFALLVAPSPAIFAENTRLGLTVSRKVGNAVVRNRVRRVLREAWRQQAQRAATGFDHVLIAFPQAATLSLQDAHQELACLLAKAIRWASSPASASRSSRPTG